LLKHIAVGLFVPYCVFLFIYIRKGFRSESRVLGILPWVMMLCAIWSFLPSIMNKLPLGFLNKIVNNFLISNIFFFYGILRKLSNTGSTFGLAMIFFMVFSLLGVYSRHLLVQEREIVTLRKRME